MKKYIRLTVISTIMLMTAVSVSAKPQGPKTQPTWGKEDTHSTEGVPVGTATLLMLGLGGATLGYKLHKNRQKD